MTNLTFSKYFLSDFVVRIAGKLSGVVINMWGGFFTCFALIDWGVSPCLTSTLIPVFSPHHFNLSNRSLFNAFNGAIYKHEIGRRLSLRIEFMTGIIAASVFPLPVGAIIRTLSPSPYIALKA
ncbi:122aa long hypothetical protein [Pyrococcus horikoshii OT3]|uniref:Uncharacterized protein n=1 Tax=Pyrococcus horikoshii (strain ATCC 700860 / DSM 12428 / JCM 9974 / NBRC 100139 / OT-3) TaxID=70601 RepID=O59037_PYRHO|nr:122aa long hypothetical protein [Pyrococcus horikoshii OT3]